MNTELLVYIGMPFIAALIGYFTNWVAIKMLFRPHREKRILGIRLPFTPGLIPSRRGEMAEKTGSVIARHLVNEESVSARFDSPGVKAQFHSIISGYIDELLERDFDSLDELIPDGFRSDWLELISRLKLKVHEQLGKVLNAPSTEKLLRQNIGSSLNEWLQQPIGELLPAEFLDSLPELLRNWLSNVTDDADFEKRVREFIDRKADSLLEEDKQLSEYVPAAIKETAYAKIEQFMPFMLDKVVAVLEDEDLKKRVKIALYEWVDKVFEETFDEDSAWDQLKFGLMETFFMSTEEIKLKLDSAVEDAVPRFAKLLRQEEVQARIQKALINSVDGFLEKSISDFNLSDETISGTKEEIVKAVLGIARSQNLRDELSRFATKKLEKTRDRSLQELLPGAQMDRFSEQLNQRVIELIKSESTVKALTDLISQQMDELLQRPIGKLKRLFPVEFIPKSKTWISEKALEIFKRETPKVIEAIDVETLVNDQIAALPLPEMERLIMEISRRQLRAITWFGALLGFVIGLVQVAVLLLRGGLGA